MFFFVFLEGVGEGESARAASGPPHPRGHAPRADPAPHPRGIHRATGQHTKETGDTQKGGSRILPGQRFLECLQGRLPEEGGALGPLTHVGHDTVLSHCRTELSSLSHDLKIDASAQ